MTESLYGVIGLGKTGFSIARYLQKRNLNFVMLDTRLAPPNLHEFKLEFPKVEVFLGACDDAPFNEITEIITSPAVPHNAPLLEHIKKINVIGDIELLARSIKNTPVIAITGTNGKSTVTTLVGKMLKDAGFKVAVAGNIGTPVLSLLDDETNYEIWVLELSSFQLEYIYSLETIAATILNITPDHLDMHPSYEQYVKAKQLIYKHAKLCLMSRDYIDTKPFSLLEGQELQTFGLDAASSPNWGIVKEGNVLYLCQGKHKIINTEELKIYGSHNWQNVLAACALAKTMGVDFNIMRKVLLEFTGLAHRTQNIRDIDGVTWINDSKGTNVGATISAISGIGPYIKGKIILIAGGQGKGADFSSLKACVSVYVKSLILIGEDANKIEQALIGIVEINKAQSLEEAIRLANEKASRGDVVLLSPACASFDMFRDFNHRGECYINLVQSI